MRSLRHFRNAFLDLAEVVGSLEGNDTSEIESSDLEQNQFDQHLEDHKGNDTSQIESPYVDQSPFDQRLKERYQYLQQENDTPLEMARQSLHDHQSDGRGVTCTKERS